MTDQRSYEDGKANRPMAPGTDQHSYAAGQQAREAAMGHNINATSEADNKQKTDWSTFWGPKVEVPGVAYTLILVAPFIWMVYPVLGFTIYAVVGGIFLLGRALHIPGHWTVILGSIPCVMSFFWGMAIESKMSQLTVYRWIRGLMRIAFSFVGTAALLSSDIDFNDISPQAWVGGFFGTLIIYLIMQRMDLIYFPAAKEMKKIQEKLAKGERPKRPMLKRLFFGFCWFIPTVLVLNLIVNIGARLAIEDNVDREAFYAKANAIIFCVNAAIWYLLCLIGKLPGTGKYMFSKAHEEVLLDRQPETPADTWTKA